MRSAVLLIAGPTATSLDERVERLLSRRYAVWSVTLSDSLVKDSAAWCAIVTETSVGARATNCLVALRETRQSLPRVLVTACRNSANLSPASLAASAVLSTHELDQALSASICRVRCDSIRATIRLAATLTSGLSREAHRAVFAATQAQPQVRSLTELRLVLGKSRVGLWRDWRRGREERIGHLKLLVDWLLLLEAIPRAVDNTSLVDIAAQVGVHEHTLQRAAHRLYGAGLSEVVRDAATYLGDGSVKTMIGELLGELPEALLTRADDPEWCADAGSERSVLRSLP